MELAPKADAPPSSPPFRKMQGSGIPQKAWDPHPMRRDRDRHSFGHKIDKNGKDAKHGRKEVVVESSNDGWYDIVSSVPKSASITSTSTLAMTEDVTASTTAYRTPSTPENAAPSMFAEVGAKFGSMRLNKHVERQKQDVHNAGSDGPDEGNVQPLHGGVSAHEESVIKKRCVFLHGTGQVNPREETPTFESYWGLLEKHTPQCRDRHFAHVNSVVNAWHDEVLYREYCSIASRNGQGSDGPSLIRDTIVFSHSAGTLILAAGIEAGVCDFDPATSSWYIVGYHPSSMHNLTSAVSMYGVLSNYSLVRSVTSELGQYMTDIHWIDANGNRQRMYTCFNEMSDECEGMPSVETRQRISEIVQHRVSGAMCTSATLQQVPCRPCMEAMAAEFTNSYKDAFYAAQLNHQDITCLNGDGDEKDAKPCSWYSLCD